MPIGHFNNVGLYYEIHGSGEPLVLVHGSWTDHHDWDLVISGLAAQFQVVLYDRRGHSLSERPETQGSVYEDAVDLAALVEGLGLAPAHIIGHSYGGIIGLQLAVRRPDLFHSLLVHEAPLFEVLLTDGAMNLQETEHARLSDVIERLSAGDYEGGAKAFVDGIIFGAGTWDARVTLPLKRKFIENAPTFLDELRDPDRLSFNVTPLAGFPHPSLLSSGGKSRPMFQRVAAKLAEAMPQARAYVFEDAGHVPQVSHPQHFVEVVSGFIHERVQRLHQ